MSKEIRVELCVCVCACVCMHVCMHLYMKKKNLYHSLQCTIFPECTVHRALYNYNALKRAVICDHPCHCYLTL